jgi:hypothetical protein
VPTWQAILKPVPSLSVPWIPLETGFMSKIWVRG